MNRVYKLKKELVGLIEASKMYGLNNNDVENARSFFDHREFELCFDIIITQLYEYDLKINRTTYNTISKIGELMALPQKDYDFMEKLIANDIGRE